jgi:hypothetical protein
MSAGAQFERCFGVVLRAASWAALLASLLVSLTWPSARAQQASATVGNIEGDSVTVSAGSSGVNLLPNPGATVAVPNGGVINLPSGQARLMLVSGGEIDICGPAKLTLLQSGDSVTLALDFGRVRVQLATSTDLRIFTPTILATPLAINGAPRDITVRLDPDDSLCVRAGSGALLLEGQFSNEKIVVPQAGQFLFAQGRLVPVARNDMECECVLKEARVAPAAPPWPALSLTSPPQTAASSKPPEAANPKMDDQPLPPEVEYSILARPNDVHPIEPQAKAAPPPPPEASQSYKIDVPPLTFSADSPAPPPLPATDMILLIRTAEVDPDVQFTGHVDPPPVEEQATPHRKRKSAHRDQPDIEGAKPGFWGRLKHFFLGRS